jgi:hypothetical protein
MKKANSSLHRIFQSSVQGTPFWVLFWSCGGDLSYLLPFFFSWSGSSPQARMPAYVSILRLLQMIWVWRATVEWYWQGKTEDLGEKPVTVPLCPPQSPHGLTRARTRASAVTGRRLTTWTMAWPCLLPLLLTVWVWYLCFKYLYFHELLARNSLQTITVIQNDINVYICSRWFLQQFPWELYKSL